MTEADEEYNMAAQRLMDEWAAEDGEDMSDE